jgi:hypothetical protein
MCKTFLLSLARFEFRKAVTAKITIFWDVIPCILILLYPKDGVSTFFRNICKQLVCDAPLQKTLSLVQYSKESNNLAKEKNWKSSVNQSILGEADGLIETNRALFYSMTHLAIRHSLTSITVMTFLNFFTVTLLSKVRLSYFDLWEFTPSKLAVTAWCLLQVRAVGRLLCGCCIIFRCFWRGGPTLKGYRMEPNSGLLWIFLFHKSGEC